MEIIVARKAGFCFGVKRALKATYETAESTQGEVATIGPLIHNPQVVKRLEGIGVRSVERVEEFHGEALIIRSHGVPKSVMEAAESSGLNVVDATCPFVKKAQDYAHLMNEEGYRVIIVGDKDHPEVQGILAYAGETALVASELKDLAELKKTRKIGIVAQTTTSIDRLQRVVVRCLEVSRTIKVYNTICDATYVRQKEAEEIARKVDVMLVVGGRNSGNTNRLADICRQTGTKTFHIETHEEIETGWFENVLKVGITAGASTPDWIIDGVNDYLIRMSSKSDKNGAI